MIDLNTDGLISLNEFEKWYRNLPGVSNEASRLFASYDLNGDNTLTVPEFVPLAFVLSRQPAKEEENFFRVF